MTYDWKSSWRDLPAGRAIDSLVAEQVLGVHAHQYERISANTYICSREDCDWRGPSEGVSGYSTRPEATADVLAWFEEQGWSWEIAYRWGLGYRGSATKQREEPFAYKNVDDCPTWPLAVCRLALALAEDS